MRSPATGFHGGLQPHPRPLKEMAAEADKGIVTVHSVRHETDWFNNPVENTGYFAGALIAQTSTEYLILTTEDAVEEADAIRVTFADGTEAAGTRKQTDRVSGKSIISVSRSAVSQETAARVEILTLGNSYQMKMGDLVLAIGSPMGIVHSVDYGSVGYVARSVPVTDGSIRVMYADVEGNAPKGTFLLNLSGEIVGMVADGYAGPGSQDVTTAVGISDYKGIIERMSNGLPTAWLGIQGQDITAEMEEQDLPARHLHHRGGGGKPRLRRRDSERGYPGEAQRGGGPHGQGAADPDREPGGGNHRPDHRGQKRHRRIQRIGISGNVGSQVNAWLPL